MIPDIGGQIRRKVVGCYKLNVDGAISVHQGVVGMVCVIRNHIEEVMELLRINVWHI